jgi:surface antigen
MKIKKVIFSLAILVLGFGVYFIFFKDKYQKGQVIDQFNGVEVHYNGSMNNTFGRNVTKDGYNIGLKYQCVEFVKRYYYEYYHHKMPNSYGNALDFYNTSLKDGEMNIDRDLVQYSNPSKVEPKIGDLVVFDQTSFNPFGHVAIVSKVEKDQIEVIQQNTGSSRSVFELQFENDHWSIENERILGWLRKD